MIAETLSGKRIVVTGATGFLGTALVERLLRCVPDCQVYALIRPPRSGDVQRRLKRDLLGNNCFNRLRQELGSRFEDTVQERLFAIAGDVTQDGVCLDEAGKAALAQADVVIHSAAAVSFDAPLDEAVEINLLGPARVASAIVQSGSRAHLISVSTAYVAGNRRGDAPEQAITDGRYAFHLDWKKEVHAARRKREELEDRSREPARAREFLRKARREIGAAGIPLLAARAERERIEWVRDQMVRAGQARAQMLGWPDVYAYTKALGEVALGELAERPPTSIMRPSIIESALAEPHPGWIRGFRMAEPIIISYARGLLSDFPGLPEGVVDVIPVDYVVAAVLAVASQPPGPEEIPIYQVASGSRNPLRYAELVDLVRTWFRENPLYDSKGQPIVVPQWSFPGRGRVQASLKRSITALESARNLLGMLPLRGQGANLSSWLEDRAGQAQRALSYVELYGAYAECEAVFGVEHLMSLWQTLPPADQDRFVFDPATINWPYYVREVHLPSVVDHARVRTSPQRRVQSRSDRAKAQILAPERQLAVFDLENTLIASNVVESYAWLATRHMDKTDRVAFALRLIAEAPSLLALDRRDRGDFLRYFYRRYKGAPYERLSEDAEEMLSSLFLTRAFPEGIARVRAHRQMGHRTLLITGALSFAVEPLRPLFDDIICARMSLDQDRLTGQLAQVPPTGEARALALDAYAQQHGIDLADAVAYADSASDLALLEAVGFPVAVNPETKLAAIARRRGWHVEYWSRTPGFSRPLLPLGPKR